MSNNKSQKRKTRGSNSPRESVKRTNRFSVLSDSEDEKNEFNMDDYAALQSKHEFLQTEFNQIIQDFKDLKKAHTDLLERLKNPGNSSTQIDSTAITIAPSIINQVSQPPEEQSQTVIINNNNIRGENQQATVSSNNSSPPPIITYRVNVQHLLRTMRAQNVDIKITNNIDKATIKTSSKADYEKVTSYLSEQKYEYFSFTPKNERFILLILKGLNNTMTVEDVVADLNILLPPSTKYNVSKHIINKISTDNFIVKFPNDFDVYKALDIKYICLQKVHWERFKMNGVAQCKRCQGFKHVAKNCCKLYKCVKCLEVHEPGACARIDRNEGTPKCVNCKGDHPANYKNCPVFKDVLQSRLRSQQTRVNTNNEISTSNGLRIPGKSFVQAMSNDNSRNHAASTFQTYPIPKNNKINKDLTNFVDVLPNELFGCSLHVLLRKISDFNQQFNNITDNTEQKLAYLNFISSLCFKS